MKYFITSCILMLLFVFDARGEYSIPRTDVVEIDFGKRKYSIYIKLPRSYYWNRQRSYPLVLVTDDHYGFQVVSGASRFLITAGKIEPFILVGVSYSSDSRGQSGRIRDFTPVRAPDWEYETGKADQFLTFIEEKVLSYVDKNYRTKKQNRTYIGNSLGGLFGVYILKTNPAIFDNYLLGSPSVWYKNNHILGLEQAKMESAKYVFIGIGELEQIGLSDTRHNMVNGAKKLNKHLNSSPFIKSHLNVFNGADHYNAFPSSAAQGLTYLLGYSESASESE